MKTPFASNKYRVTSPFGQRTLNGETGFHSGLDLVSTGSWDIVAVAGGYAVRSRMITDKSNLTWQWGNYVCILGEDGRYYYYCHMADRTVSEGQYVKEKEKIGVMGSTGYSFGAHLHFEVREADGTTKVNAAEILGIPNREGAYTIAEDAAASGEVKNTDNYRKAIDKLVSIGIIYTPEYWTAHKNDLLYLDMLIENIADIMPLGQKKLKDKKISTQDAIELLHSAGAIKTPEYWRVNVNKIEYLNLLLQRSAAVLGG